MKKKKEKIKEEKIKEKAKLSSLYQHSIKKLITLFIGVLLAILLILSGYQEFFHDGTSGNANALVVRRTDRNPVKDYLKEIREKQDSQLQNIKNRLKPFQSSGNLSVYFLDVGHGDAIFIVTPSSNTILIDGGYEDQARHVYDFIHDLGFNYLDYAIASHPDADHIGGLDFVIKKMAYVNKVLDNGRSPYNGSQSDYRTYRSYREVALNQESYAVVRHDLKLKVDNNIDVFVFVPYENKTYFNNTDDNSLIVKLVYGNVSFLFTGDCEVPCEERLLEKGKDIRSTILKVAHHGDSDATSKEFLDAVKPEVAIISTGDYERFGHPHKEVIQRLEENGIAIYRTDRDGNVIITTDGSDYSVEAAVRNESIG